MDDLWRAANAIIASARQKLGDEIALIVHTGSRLRGTHSAYSDLDLYYVPATEAEAHCTILYAGTPIDFYPIAWRRLEQWANYEQPLTALLTDVQLLYVRSPADRARFEQLQARIATLQLPEQRLFMVNKAIALFKQTGYRYFLLDVECRPADTFAWQREAWKIVEMVLHALAVMNQTFYHSDCGKNLAEVLALPKRPAHIAEIIAVVVNAADYGQVKTAIQRLLQQTKQLLAAEHQAMVTLTPFAEQFRAYYPEIREQINKILAACEMQNAQRALSAIVQIQNEVADFLSRTADGQSAADLGVYRDYQATYQALGLPDLLPYVHAQDFIGLRQAVETFDHKIQAILTQHGVALNRIATPEELDKIEEFWQR